MELKYTFKCAPQFVAAVDGRWLPIQGVKFDFQTNGEVEVSLTSSITDAMILDHFWEPNGGSQIPFDESVKC